MSKSPEAFRTISEVADWLGVQAHVLRFWESKFTQVKPVKRAGGRRYYRPGDMQLLGGIRTLLYDEGMTIKGVQKLLREQGVAAIASFSQPLGDGMDAPLPNHDGATVLPFAAARAPDNPAGSADADDAAAPESPLPAAEGAEAGPDALAEPGDHDARAAPAASQASFDLDGPEPPRQTGPAAVVVDAPDPPPMAEIPYAPGPLVHLAGLERVSADQAQELAALERDLRAWAERVAARHHG
ncbi:MerR family transcriptional regulator [Pontibaca methylaminivorans]|uniref:MerR HTH family regulatory protein n=1 Tax=Pontibaca methylaminivorans TaxID=515897 RepID=A0A1R3X4A8_9RHOB|nr:MerR family transcriptional regulator [Pontibaca methylaminivorans]SIT85183.1 MerR HTH family regulatory protein [Pontibaca methylaminivorans]